MAALNFPDALSDGQTFEADTGVIYVYQGIPPAGFWSATNTVNGQQNQDARYVQRAGDDMTGNLTFNTDKIQLKAQDGSATFAGVVKSYVGNSSTGAQCFAAGNNNLTYANINNDGSAEFAGNIKLGNTSSAINDGGIELNQNLGQIDIIKASADSGYYLTGVQSNGAGGVVNRFNIAADGSAVFGDAPNNSNATGVGILDAGGAIAVQASGKLFRGHAYSNGAETSAINDDGSASFAAGDLEIRDSGQVRSTNGFLAYGPNMNSTPFRVSTAADGDPSGNIVRIFNDGSAEFAGDVEVAGYASDGTETGVTLRSLGMVNASRPQVQHPIWNGYLTGNSSPTSQIRADGSATFAGGTTIQSSGNVSLSVDGSEFDGTANNGSIYISRYGTLILHSQSNANDATAIFTTQRHTGTGTNVDVGSQIFADGSATFAGKITANRFVAFASDGIPGLQIRKSPYNSSDETITLNSDGSASFAGQVEISNIDTSSATGNSGFQIRNNGQITSQRTADGPAFSVYKGATNNATINADGSATFNGTVTASNITAFRSALSTAATSAATLADLKSAIINALTNL